MDIVEYERLTGKHLEDKHENFRSLCPSPDHPEKTPSFYIHKESYLCHCFGCGLSGFIDNVLADITGISVQVVRSKLGVPFLKIQNRVSLQKEAYFESSWIAAYKRIEMHPYLKKRGFKPYTVRLHGARWDPAGRIVFPLHRLGNSGIVGAIGRTVIKDQVPKWKVYWEGKKGEIVYQALDTLAVDIIVEGIFDVMWLNQHGFPNAAALIGAQATKSQIQQIKDNANEVILFLDNDIAGRIGQDKLATALMNSNKVTFAKYPNDKNDPQELTGEELHEAIENRQTYIEYENSRCR